MDRDTFQQHRSTDRPLGQTQTALQPSTHHHSPFPPPHTTQPPAQMPLSDPFQTNRDPFLHRGSRRDSVGLSSRAWPPAPGTFSHFICGRRPLNTAMRARTRVTSFPYQIPPERCLPKRAACRAASAHGTGYNQSPPGIQCAVNARRRQRHYQVACQSWCPLPTLSGLYDVS